MKINRRQTSKEVQYQNYLKSQPEGDPLYLPYSKIEHKSNLPRCHPDHIRMIRIIPDKGYIHDPSNFMLPIPKKEFAKKYESNERVQGVCCKISNLLKASRKITGIENLNYIYLITGKRIKSFAQVPDYVTDLVVSESENLEGVGCGLFLTSMPAMMRKSSKSTAVSTSTNFPTQKLSEKPSMKLDKYIADKHKYESIESLIRDYPIPILSRLLKGDKLSMPSDKSKIEAIEERNQKYSAKFMETCRKVEVEDTNFELMPLNEYKRSKSVSPIKKSNPIVSENIDEINFSSGSDEIEEEKKNFSHKLNQIQLKSQTSRQRRQSRLSGPPEAVENFLRRYGLNIRDYQKISNEYKILVMVSSSEKKGFSMKEDTYWKNGENEQHTIAVSYLLASYDFFQKMPQIMQQILFEYFGIEKTIDFQTWICIASNLIYKCSKKPAKIDFICDFLPGKYKRIHALFQQVLKKNVDALKDFKNYECFDLKFNLKRERLKEVFKDGLIQVNEIIDILTSFLNKK
ncbi:unnamed protein product [Blepharisma stoltei]|uniref:Uncharacterized protein n=1 Tax=Blepharisma stoltei TaxID=1481888 RepID=A0AAU9JVC7_9CILI|nr:unnamed protein product [Blepharisma stoltei]